MDPHSAFTGSRLRSDFAFLSFSGRKQKKNNHVEIFDPNSESVLVSNKQSMLELQTAKATIEPPPASTDDDAVVHEHDLVILQTQAPSELLETSESSKFLTKGNPV